MFKRLAVGLLFAFGIFLADPAMAQGISQKTATCDVKFPNNCIKPNSDGSINVSGSISSSTTATASTNPTPVVAGTGKPLNIGLFSNLFMTPVTPTGTQIDLTAPSGVLGTDGATIATKANPLDIEINGAIPAGANLIGKVAIDQTTPGTTNGVQVVAGTSGGASSFTFEVAASDNHQVIKNGAGTLFTMDGFSIHTAALFVRLYDAGTGFNGCNSATGLLWEGNIPGSATGAGFIKAWGDVGKAFATGLSICVTGAYGNTNTTNATASVASVNLGYK